MRREALPLLRAARRGNAVALFELGRGYLLGQAPLPYHPDTGIRYLKQSAQSGHRAAGHLLVESLALDALVSHGLIDELVRCATEGSTGAQIKLGVWLATDARTRAEGLDWLRRAERAGHTSARVALAHVLSEDATGQAGGESVRLLRAAAAGGNESAWVPLARAALANEDDAAFWHALQRACQTVHPEDRELAMLVVEALRLDEQRRRVLDLPGEHLRCALTVRSDLRDACATYMLGRMLAGFDEPLRVRCRVPAARKLGRAISLLQSAADSGVGEALLVLADLYRAHPNLPYASRHGRYYLERAVRANVPAARARLGEQCLLQARGSEDLAQAIELLQPHARQGDLRALALLSTLTRPVNDGGELAQAVLTQLTTRHALLACRLALARSFGLTQHEALTLDPHRAYRPWGLWVDPGLFFTQRRKRASRAVPCLSVVAHEALMRAQAVFRGIDCGPAGPEGDYRQRVYTLTAALRRTAATPALFFAPLTLRQLDAMRGGLAWRRRHAELLQPLGVKRADASAAPLSPTIEQVAYGSR